jgi:hypothetical protein
MLTTDGEIDIVRFPLLPLIKIVCSVNVVLKRPLMSISQIPRNYYRYVFVVDFFKPPQVIPEAEEVVAVPHESIAYFSGNAYAIVQAMVQMSSSMLRDKRIPKFLATLVVLGFGIIIFVMPTLLLAFSFRFAVKSTALFWLPLLWLLYQTRSGINILDRIELNTRQPWTKLILAYSVVILVIFILKLALIFEIWRFWELNWVGPLGVLATRLVAPFELPLWQIASALNASLAWIFLFRAQRHLLARHSTEAWPEVWVRKEYVAFQGVRTTLSLYAIACTLYLGLATACDAQWPPIRFILFPWTVSSSSP